jgi:hypothetical protein
MGQGIRTQCKGQTMPGDPRECRERAARCLELATEAANEGIKQTFLRIARHWQILAEELERAKSILDDEKGTIRISLKKRRKTKPKSGKARKKRKFHAGVARTKRANGLPTWGLW